MIYTNIAFGFNLLICRFQTHLRLYFISLQNII